MARRYISHAVESVAAYFEANFPTYVAQINTEESASLAVPVVYSRGSVPSETRSPALEVVDDRSDVFDTATNVWDHTIDVNLILKAIDADLIAHQIAMRQYISAMHLTVHSDGTLGDCVIQAIRDGSDRSEVLEDGRLIGVANLELIVRMKEDAP